MKYGIVFILPYNRHAKARSTVLAIVEADLLQHAHQKVLPMLGSRSLRLLLSAMLLSPPLYAVAQPVHSAAGVLPHQVPAAPVQQPRQFAPIQNQRMPPPLPGASHSTSQQNAAPVASSSVGTPPANADMVPATASTAPVATETATAPIQGMISFRDALQEEVTIDIVDMALVDLMEQLAPTGWRLRFQHVDDAIKNKRVDLTAFATRGAVMHQILAEAGLTVEPFEAFQTPLMLITSSQ